MTLESQVTVADNPKAITRVVSSALLDPKVVCSDNCEAMRVMPSESVDLVVTSPPYDDLRTYGGYSWDFYGVAWNLKRLLKQGGVIVWVVADATQDGSETGSSMEQALHFKRLGLRLHDTMIYGKVNYVPRTHNRCEQAWEYMFVFSAGTPKTWNPPMIKSAQIGGGATMRERDGSVRPANTARCVNEMKIRPNVWDYTLGEVVDGHPATFPQKLAKEHIQTWSNPGDVVLDPFCGSGTTIMAAKELCRQSIGIEINSEYVKIINRRIAQDALALGV
jgi:site-specific DNA-methyltransferase (adenine-specific)